MRNSSTTCVDAGCLVRLVADPKDAAIQRLWTQWEEEQRRLVAPTLLLYEVTNALHRYHRSGERTIEAMESALADAFRLPIELHGDSDLQRGAFVYAARFSLPAAYDAHYLALADRLGIDFWTTDRKLANAVRPALAWVNLVER